MRQTSYTQIRTLKIVMATDIFRDTVIHFPANKMYSLILMLRHTDGTGKCV